MTDSTQTERVFAKLDKGVMNTIKSGTEAYTNATNAFKQAAIDFVGTIKGEVTHDEIPLVVKQAREIYAEYFPDNNKCQVFGNRVALLLASGVQLEYKNRKGDELKSDAGAAALLPEDTMKQAFKALNVKLGHNRAAGGGRAPQTPDGAPANGAVTTVFSTVEMKSQLAGLFGNSKSPLVTLNKLLSEYHTAAIPSADYEAFQAWQQEHAKTAA